MKTIGLLGGMSWESTTTYYREINRGIKQRLGGLHSAKILLYSVDFAEIEAYQARGDWEKSAAVLADAAQKVERAGADFLVICTNTMHKVAPQIQAKISIPILHIAEAAADELRKHRVADVALLGTKYTMTQDFYKEKLTAAGIRVLIPDPEEIEGINRVIYEELCLGTVSEAARELFLQVIAKLEGRGARGVILGCTEIGLLIKQEDMALPLFDTTLIHAAKAAEMAL